MDDIDLFSLITGEEVISSTFKIKESKDSDLSAEGIVIVESTTIIENIPFGSRNLDEMNIKEIFIEDLTWLL